MLLIMTWAVPSISMGHAFQSPNAPLEMLFTQLGSAEGLSQGAVMSIAQDSQGFIWLGTEDGLDRFDGYELRHLIHARGDRSSLPNNWISALTRDASGRLWIGSDGGGLAWYDVQNGRFVSAQGADNHALVESNAQIRALQEDREGRLWVGTRSSGVYMLDRSRKTALNFRYRVGDPTSLSDDSVFSISEDASGMIWIGTARGLDRIDPRNLKVEAFGERLRTATGTQNSAVNVTALHTDRRGIVWIGLDNALASLNPADSRITRYSSATATVQQCCPKVGSRRFSRTMPSDSGWAPPPAWDCLTGMTDGLSW